MNSITINIVTHPMSMVRGLINEKPIEETDLHVAVVFDGNGMRPKAEDKRAVRIFAHLLPILDEMTKHDKHRAFDFERSVRSLCEAYPEYYEMICSIIPNADTVEVDLGKKTPSPKNEVEAVDGMLKSASDYYELMANLNKMKQESEETN